MLACSALLLVGCEPARQDPGTAASGSTLRPVETGHVVIRVNGMSKQLGIL